MAYIRSVVPMGRRMLWSYAFWDKGFMNKLWPYCWGNLKSHLIGQDVEDLVEKCAWLLFF